MIFLQSQKLKHLMRGSQEIECQEIETGDRNYRLQHFSGDRMYLLLISKIVQEIKKALGGHYFRFFFSNLT